MKNFLILILSIFAISSHGAGLTVASTNGVARGLSLRGNTTNAVGTVLVDSAGNVYAPGYFGATFDPLGDAILFMPNEIQIAPVNGAVYLYGTIRMRFTGELGDMVNIGANYFTINAAGGTPLFTFDRGGGNQTNTGTIKAAAFVGDGGGLTGVAATAYPIATNLFEGLLFNMKSNSVATITTATNIYFTGLDYSSPQAGRWGEMIIKPALNSNIIVTNPASWFTSDAQITRNLFSNQVMVISVEAILNFITNAAFSIFQGR